MADGPWRCSECGTVNEPVANSCRTCGRWPSLFDLEASVVEDARAEERRQPAGASFPEPASVEPEAFEPPSFEPASYEAEPVEPEPSAAQPYELEPPEEADDEGSSRRRRTLTSLIVPIAFAIYILVSIVFGDRG